MGKDDDERTVVQTYVPAYQKRLWREHADALGMSQSEFVRTMVQAGRRGFSLEDNGPMDADGDPEPPHAPEAVTPEAENSRSNGPDPRGSALEDRIQAILRETGHASWEELVERITTDMEDRIETALETLQQRNSVRYSGRQGGYTLIEE